MSFTLLDQGAENFEFTSSVWHWKAALEIIRGLDIIDESRVRQLGYNAMGTKMDIDEARLIGEKIRDEILPKVAPGHRMFADGTVTDAPDDGTFYKDDDEEWKNYSVSHQWLKDFSDFCLRSKGFQVF
jgi:hypothetical protein